MIFQFKLCLKQFNRRLGPDSKVSISEDGEFIAFSDIEHNLLLFNRSRNTVDLLGKKSKPLKFILICDSFVTAVEEESSELYVYSIKSRDSSNLDCRLKKSISFSSSKITHLSYSKDRKLLVIQSKSNCIVIKLPTLTKQKVLSCSTSNFVSSSFTSDGKHLVNFFDDSSVIFWNLDTYTNEQTSNSNIQYITAGDVGLSKYIVLACNSNVYVANYIRNRTRFQKAAEVKGKIENISFINHYVVIQSTYGLYIGSIFEDHKISAMIELMAVGVKLFQANGEYLVTTNLVNDIIVTKGGREIELGSLNKQRHVKQIQNNLLDNVGFYCAGGFDNKQGCPCSNQSFIKTDIPPSTTHYLQKLYKSILISPKDLHQFSKQKLTVFLLKRNRFADKHRAITYQYLLNLPLNINNYKNLVRKGLNPQINHLRLKYPIKNEALFTTFQFIISLLSHYCPEFSDIEYIPALIYPLVLAFGQDQLFCFQLSIYFLTHWMSPLFQSYPQPNINLIYSIQQIIQHQKPSLISHFRSNSLPLSHVIWFIYSTFFTETFNRNNYMSMLDTLICFNDNPSMVIFEVAAYILQNSKQLMMIKGERELFEFVGKESGEDCDKLMRLVHKLSGKYKDQIQYQWKGSCITSEGYKKFKVNRPQAVFYERQRKRAEERQYIDMKREKDFYEEQLVFEENKKGENQQAEGKEIIWNEIVRYRDMEYERRKFEEVNPRGRLELIENKGLEIPSINGEKYVSYSDIKRGGEKSGGCCTNQRVFERTRDG